MKVGNLLKSPIGGSSPTQAKPFALLSWMVVAMAIVASLLAAGTASAQVAPANAVIGNQASATYVDTSNPSVTLTSSSNTVQTTVSQVYSALLSANGAQTRPANQQVCYPHSIKNTGNGTDTFSLTGPTYGGAFTHLNGQYFLDANQDGQPDNGTAITTTGSLNAGQTFNFVVCATTPASATPPQAGTIVVTATSSAPVSPPSFTNTDTTTIGNCTITLTKSLSSTPPPGLTPVAGGPAGTTNLYVVLNYQNSGSVACNNVVISDVLPSGFLYQINSGRWSNTGAAVTLSDTGASEVAAATTAGMSSYSAPTSNLTSGTVSATITSVPSSTSGNLYFQVTISATAAVGITAATTNSATATFVDSISAVAGSTTSNAATFNVAQVASVAFNGSPVAPVGTPGGTYGIADGEPANVTVPSASPGQTITWTNVVWNTGNATDTFTVRFFDGTNTVTGNSATFTGTNCSPSAVGANACTFPANTTFTVYRSDGTTTLLGTPPDTGPIPLPAAGVCPAPYVTSLDGLRCGYVVIVKATIPIGAATGTGPHAISLQATSVFNSSATDSVRNILTSLVANTVDLTNGFPATAGNGQGPDDGNVKGTNTVTPGISSTTTTRFPLYIINTGGAATIYDLTATYISVPTTFAATPTGLSNPPVNWTIQFRLDGGGGNCATVTGGVITSTGAVPIAAGANKLVCAEVVIPPTNQGGVGRPTDSPPGDYVIQFRAQDQGNPAVFDTKRDRVTLNQAHQVSITPNGLQQTSPGGAVTYLHTMTNSGNVPETISFPGSFLLDSQVPGYAWTSGAYVDDGGNLASPSPNGVLNIGTDTAISTATTFTMAPNSTRTIFVRVNAPAQAGSPPNVTTITATYTTGTASATDTTTLTSGLRLDKYQVLTSCASVPTMTLSGGLPTGATWSTAAIPAGAGTVPGSCIAYVIVGTNTTATNISNITISDIVPSNTKFETGCTPASPNMTTGPLFASVPAQGFTGTITALSATSPAGPALSTAALLPGGTVSLQFCVKIN